MTPNESLDFHVVMPNRMGTRLADVCLWRGWLLPSSTQLEGHQDSLVYGAHETFGRRREPMPEGKMAKKMKAELEGFD